MNDCPAKACGSCGAQFGTVQLVCRLVLSMIVEKTAVMLVTVQYSRYFFAIDSAFRCQTQAISSSCICVAPA